MSCIRHHQGKGVVIVVNEVGNLVLFNQVPTLSCVGCVDITNCYRSKEDG